eukprot:scaffold8114_cov112-Isochrysis_galbana.AAC.3
MDHCDNNGRHHRPTMSFAQFTAALELTASAVVEKQWTVRCTAQPGPLFPAHLPKLTGDPLPPIDRVCRREAQPFPVPV